MARHYSSNDFARVHIAQMLTRETLKINSDLIVTILKSRELLQSSYDVLRIPNETDFNSPLIGADRPQPDSLIGGIRHK